MAQVVQCHSRESKRPVYPTYSVQWLSMSYRWMQPEHQQPWYWLISEHSNFSTKAITNLIPAQTMADFFHPENWHISWHVLFIVMASYEPENVAFDPQLHCMFKAQPDLHQRHHQNSELLTLCTGNPPVTPLHTTCNAESTLFSWYNNIVVILSENSSFVSNYTTSIRNYMANSTAMDMDMMEFLMTMPSKADMLVPPFVLTAAILFGEWLDRPRIGPIITRHPLV